MNNRREDKIRRETKMIFVRKRDIKEDNESWWMRPKELESHLWDEKN